MRERLSVADVMRVLNVSRNTITAWLKDGVIEGEQVGDYNTAPYWFEVEEVERLRLQKIKELQREIDFISTPAGEYLKQRYSE